MSKASTKTKARWNSANYVQIKVSIYPEIAEAFKTACTNNGVSMASVLSQFMAEYGAVANAKKTMANPVSSRKKRRNLVNALICQFEQVRDAEEQVLDNTPENLRNSSNFETTEGIISLLDEVLETLEGIY